MFVATFKPFVRSSQHFVFATTVKSLSATLWQRVHVQRKHQGITFDFCNFCEHATFRTSDKLSGHFATFLRYRKRCEELLLCLYQQERSTVITECFCSICCFYDEEIIRNLQGWWSMQTPLSSKSNIVWLVLQGHFELNDFNLLRQPSALAWASTPSFIVEEWVVQCETEAVVPDFCRRRYQPLPQPATDR